MRVAVANTKGGAGKTTTAVCIALEAADQGVDVCLVDADPQGAGAKWAHQIGVAAPHVRSRADVVNACGSHRLAIIDTPPGADPRTVCAIEAADLTVAATGLGPGDMDGLMDFLRMVDPDLIVPNRLDARRIIHKHAMTFLESRFPGRVTVGVPTATAIEWAQASQEALPPLCPPAVAYRMILSTILALDGVAR